MAMNPRKGILSVKISDENMLYHAYMPFLQNGGLFIPTNKTYQLGEEVFILLTLMDEPDKIPVAGNIVWITPKGAQGNQAAGIGVHFSNLEGSGDSADIIRGKIENYLVEKLKSDKITHTM
jgi:type IV pilus assembly protein PilZ